MPKKPTLEEVTKNFGKAHAEEAEAKSRMDKYRKQFFDLLKAAIPKSHLARQTLYYEGDDPIGYVATMYPKWKIIKKEIFDGPDDGSNTNIEYRIIIEEDPTKKSWSYVNPIDGKVYQRTVAESAPSVDLERMKEENEALYQSVTILPPQPDRVLKPLTELDEYEKEKLISYLLPPKLTNRMEKPRPANPEELE